MYEPHYLIPDLNTHTTNPSGKSRLIFADPHGSILCTAGNPVITDEIPREMKSNISSPILIGSSSELNWMVSPVTAPIPDHYAMLPLRAIAPLLPSDLLGILGRAIHLVRFDTTTRYCGQCGAMNRPKEDEIAKICPECGLLTFPKISPAVIVRITDGDRILLARSPHFPPGMYSILAGFIEPGESLEAGLHREVYEEVGIRIGNLSYFGSQPWPFPDSLMIGFTARYVSGEIRTDDVEIEDAKWYDRNTMPELPGHLSIAHALIKDYLDHLRI